MDQDDAELRSELLDLTRVDLEMLSAMPDSAFALSLNRILREKSTMLDQYAAFQNSI